MARAVYHSFISTVDYVRRSMEKVSEVDEILSLDNIVPGLHGVDVL